MGWMEKYEKAVNGQKNTGKKKKRPELAVETTSGRETTTSGGSSGWIGKYEKALLATGSPSGGGSSGWMENYERSVRTAEALAEGESSGWMEEYRNAVDWAENYYAYKKYLEDLTAAKEGRGQRAYEDYLQSEDYRKELEESRQERIRAATGYADSGYNTARNLSSIQGESKTAQELKARADYEASLLQQHEDWEVMSRDMAEFETWSAADREALKTYIIESEREKYDLMGYYSKGQARYNADALFQKYGAQKVKEMAESYGRWKNEETAEEIDKMSREAVDGGFWAGAGHSALTVGANLAGSMTAPMSYLGELAGRTGRYHTMDPNNAGTIFNRYSGAVRDQVAKNIEGEDGSAVRKGLSYLYQGVMSAADSSARLLVGKGLVGGLKNAAGLVDAGAVAGAKAVSLGLAGLGSAGQSMSDYSAQGIEPGKAFLMSVASGGLEVATEYLPLDNLMDIAKGGYQGIRKTLTDILTQAGTEVVEEEVNFLGSLLMEAAVLQEKTPYHQQVNALVADGMSLEEARQQVNGELVQEALDTAIVSAISGGGSAIGGVALGTAANRLDQSVQERRTAKNDKAITKQIAREIDPQKAASTLEEIEAEYGAFGETVRKAYNEGQDISEFAIGFRYAFEIGRQGGSEKALQSVRYITQSQRETAYELGRTAAEEERRQNREQSGIITAGLIGEDGITEEVGIREIVSMTPDQMELRLEDGRTVTDEQLSFAGDGAEVLNKVWELGMDAESANEVLRASRGTDLSETELAAGIEEGFRYGRYGYDAQRLAKTQTSAQLPDAVRSAAYRAGQAYRAQLREAEKSTAQTDGMKYSVKHTADNRPVAVIEKDIFDGKFDDLSERDRVKIAKNAIKGFRPGIPVSGRLIGITRKTAEHFANSDYTDKLRNHEQKLYEDKLNIAQNIDDVVYASTDYINEALKHPRNDSFVQFARGTVLLDIGGRKYAASVIVGYTSMNEMVLYDIQDLESTEFSIKEKKAQPTLAGNESDTRKTAAPSMDSISEERENVNREESRETAKKGAVHFDGDRSGLTERQRVSLRALEHLAEMLGVQIHVYEEQDVEGTEHSGKNGWYDTQTGEMHINLRAGQNGEAVMLFTAAHELTHFIRQWSEAKFQTLADFLVAEYVKLGTDVDGLVMAQIEKAKQDGREISYDEAFEEMVADSMETMLADGNVVERLAELKKKDRKLWKKIKDFIKELAGKIRKVYEGLTPDSVEGRYVAEMKDAAERLQSLFTEGLMDASESYQRAEKNTTQEGSVKYQAKFANGEKVVWIDNSGFTNSQLKDPNAIANYIAAHIGEVYKIIESGQSVYIGKDLPGEYTHSKYTSYLQKRSPALLKAKNKATPALGEMIEIATNRRWEKTKHAASKDAKFGMYRYDTKFAFPIKDQRGNVTSVKAYDAELVIRNASDGKKYLYDIVNIKEDTASALDLRHKEARKGSHMAATQSNVSGNNVAQGAGNVKEKSSARSGGSVSNRSLLVNALESTAQNEQELEKLQEYRAGIEKYNELDQQLQEVRGQIREISFAEGPRDSTKLTELQNEAARIAKQLDRFDGKLLKLEASGPLKELLERAKKKGYEKARRQQEAAKENYRERQKISELRQRIRRTVKKLDTLLKSETKEKHVPDSMKKAVAEALSLMNGMELGTAEKRISILQNEIRELESKLEQAAEQRKPELEAELQARLDEKYLALQRYEKSGGRLASLRDAYADIRNSTDPDIAAGYDAEVAGALAELAESIKDTSFMDMSREQLQDVLDMYTMVLTRIRDANKQLGARRGETLRNNAAETEADIRKFGIPDKDPGVVADKLGKLVRGFSWNNLRPVDAFHRLGSGKLEQLYMDLVDGMAQRGRQVREIAQFITDIRKKTGYRSFDLKEAETYTTVDGEEMKLTLAEKMSIYAYSRREQAFDHMTEGGFTYAKDLTYKEKGKTKVHTGKAKTWRLSLEDLQAICSSLTVEQRQYADAVQQFLSEFGAHGDKVNMELYGIKLFNKEKYYFPLQSDRDYRKSVENQMNSTMTAASLKGDGMTKKTKPHANNPIVLEDFDRVVFRHLDKMLNYANLVLPLENLRRVFDYQTAPSEGAAPASMKALIGATFGREAQQYIEQFLTDANGTRMSGGVQNPLESLFTRNKGMAVAANLSVMIQQISAVVRAGAEISPWHLVWAAQNRKGVKLYDEMVEYAPIAVIKDMGGFDTGSNRSLEDYIGFEEAPNSAKKLWNSMQKLFGWGAETMDKVGWCLIWNGVKREVASRKQYQVNSEEFLRECGRRFTEVIVKTQVYDSVLSRSGYMRDKHGTMRYLTSFMGEPTVQAGMVFNSHLDVVRAIRQKKDVRYHVKKLVRTDSALIAALVVNGMLKAIPYAMRDDDEDEGFWERWAKHLGDALSEWKKPWELLPILRNIEDMANGRTIEQPDMALLSDLLQVGTKVIHVLQDEEAMVEMQPDDWYALAKELAGSVGNILGAPVKNIWRDMEGVIRIWKDATDGIDSDGKLLDALLRGYHGEEKSRYEGIYDAAVSGDMARLEALKASYKTPSSYESAVRKALRLHDPRIKEMADARYEDDYDRLEELSYEIEAEGVFDMATIRAAYEAERAAQGKERGIILEEDSETGEEPESTVFSMEEYYASIRSGSKDSIRTAYNALLEEKKQEYYTDIEAEDSIASSVTSKVRGEYLGEDISRADAKSILTEYGGKSSGEAESEIKKWEFQMKYHYAWGSRDRCYRSGSISRSQLETAVRDIEGATSQEAREYVDFLELE